MAQDRDGLIVQNAQVGGRTQAQRRRPRSDGWTREDKAAFMAALAETCNASESARSIGKSRASAYARRARDKAFARAWEDALEQGYAEIEAMLMREVLNGSRSEEITLDADGVEKGRKVTTRRDLSVALRLLTLHHQQVIGIRAARLGAAGKAAPGQDQGPENREQALARMRRMLEEIRRRKGRDDGQGRGA